ncbi:MAG: hypothetical protein LQ350_003262 [Teloschistes chrysophthalmus]|nr:MAG: hypothetical protein LQ350_003262 [Niorma chrysophthalma]
MPLNSITMALGGGAANDLLDELRGGGDQAGRPARVILQEYTKDSAPYPDDKNSAREYLRFDADGLSLYANHASTVSISNSENVEFRWIYRAYRLLHMPHTETIADFKDRYCTTGDKNFLGSLMASN